VRIGMLTTSYPRHAGDVAGVFVRGMARALATRGHELEVLAPEPRGGVPPSEPSIAVRWVRYAPRPLRRTFYGAGVPDNVRADPLAWPGLVGFCAALLREARARARGWDAIISHWAIPCAYVAGLVRGARPHLAVLHSADVHLLNRLPARRLAVARLGAAAPALLFASAALREQTLRALPAGARAELAGRCHASAMGVDPQPPTRDRRALRRALGLTGFTALTLGRLVPIKGVEVAIEATRGLVGVALTVAGDGPSRIALERRAHPGVRFVGEVTGVAKAELLRAADALLVPSVDLPSGRGEGTPTVALEASSVGLPVIASAVGGLPEVFADGRSALFVPPGEPARLRAAIERLAADAALRRRLSRAGRRGGRRFGWRWLGPRIEQLLLDQG